MSNQPSCVACGNTIQNGEPYVALTRQQERIE